MRRLVHNWRILLGGLASASVLAVGVAAPTFARAVSRAHDRPASARSVSRARDRPASARSVSRAGDRSASALTGLAPSGTAASGGGCDLPGLPQAGPVLSALAGAPGAACGSPDTTSVARHATSMLPGLSGMTSAIPGLPDLGSVPGATSGAGREVGAGSLPGSLAGASAVTGALSGLGGAFGGAQLGSQQP